MGSYGEETCTCLTILRTFATVFKLVNWLKGLWTWPTQWLWGWSSAEAHGEVIPRTTTSWMYQTCGNLWDFNYQPQSTGDHRISGLPSTVAGAILRFFTETVTVTKFYWSTVEPLTGNSFQQKAGFHSISQCEKQMMVFRPKKVKLLLKKCRLWVPMDHRCYIYICLGFVFVWWFFMESTIDNHHDKPLFGICFVLKHLIQQISGLLCVHVHFLLDFVVFQHDHKKGPKNWWCMSSTDPFKSDIQKTGEAFAHRPTFPIGVSSMGPVYLPTCIINNPPNVCKFAI